MKKHINETVQKDNNKSTEELYMIHDDTTCSEPIDTSKLPKKVQEDIKEIEKKLGLY